MKKHLFAIIFGATLLVACAALGFVLVQSRGQYLEVSTQLHEAENRFNSLSSKKPYPSVDNINITQENLEQVEAFLMDLQDELCRGQVTKPEIEKAQFSDQMEKAFAALRDIAEAQKILLPEIFLFGFELYQGDLPDQEDVPRLVGQLDMIEGICRLLFEHRIATLETIRRDVFEQARGPGSMMDLTMSMRTPPRRRRDAGPPKNAKPAEKDEADDLDERSRAASARTSGNLYNIERVSVSFMARDANVWQILDALAQHEPFSVVTSISLKGSNAPIQGEFASPRRASPGGMMPGMMGPGEMGMMGPGGMGMMPGMIGGMGSGMMRPDLGITARQSPGDIPLAQIPRDERVVVGKDEMARVEMEINIYRFCVSPEGAESVTTASAEK